MTSRGQTDPAAIRMQRSAFLASLGRPISPPPNTRDESQEILLPTTIDLDNDDGSMPPAKRRRMQTTETAPTELSASQGEPKTRQDNVPRRVKTSPFRLTRIADLPDSDNLDTVTLHDLLGNPLIREAWIFNYCFDIDWTMQHFDADIRDLVSVRIVHGFWKKEDKSKQHIDDACRRWANVEAIPAYLPDPFGTHHTKCIILLRHDDIAEIIIHTANMLECDWTHATQAVWRSPLLLRQARLSTDSMAEIDHLRLGSGARFKLDLLRYLKAYGKRLNRLTQEISIYDFSPVRGALVGSVPSKLKNVYAAGAGADSWGHPTMFHALKEIQRQRLRILPKVASKVLQQPSHTICQCSSIATLPASWLEGTMFRTLDEHPKSTFSVIYPTAPDVGSSLAGYGCGSSIHMKIQSAAQQKQVAALWPYLCRWTRGKISEHHSLRDVAAPHIKTYISFKTEPTTFSPSPEINWALLTSANLSLHAWGSAPKMATEKGQKKVFDSTEAEVHIQSFELGVLVWPELWADDPEDDVIMVPSFGEDMPRTVSSTLASTVIGLRMPYDLPLTRYTANDVPWSSHVQHTVPDRHGRTWPPDESWIG